MWDPYQEFESAVLHNGLSVHVAQWPGRPWEAISFLVHSGAEHDVIGREGTAHFTEHLVSENACIPKNEIKQFFKSNGGSISLGMTSYHGTWYDIFLPSNTSLLKRAFDITGQMLLSAYLDKCVERERQVVIEEFNRIYSSKFSINLRLLERERKALYSGYWLERFVRPLGKPESIRLITEDDLQQYYDTHYTPPNMSIVCVGGKSLPEIVDLLSRSPFAQKKEGVRSPLPSSVVDFGYPKETGYRNRVFSRIKGTFNSVVRYRSVAKIPITDNLATIRIVCEMLSYVLTKEVRERHAWTYHIGAYYNNFRHFLEFSIQCDALAFKALNDIEKVVESCITSLWTNNVLFEEAKRNIFLQNAVVDLSGEDVCSAARNSLLTFHKIRTLSEVCHDINRVRMEDVQEVLKLLELKRRWTLVL